MRNFSLLFLSFMCRAQLVHQSNDFTNTLSSEVILTVIDHIPCTTTLNVLSLISLASVNKSLNTLCFEDAQQIISNKVRTFVERALKRKEFKFLLKGYSLSNKSSVFGYHFSNHILQCSFDKKHSPMTYWCSKHKKENRYLMNLIGNAVWHNNSSFIRYLIQQQSYSLITSMLFPYVYHTDTSYLSIEWHKWTTNDDNYFVANSLMACIESCNNHLFTLLFKFFILHRNYLRKINQISEVYIIDILCHLIVKTIEHKRHFEFHLIAEYFIAHFFYNQTIYLNEPFDVSKEFDLIDVTLLNVEKLSNINKFLTILLRQAEIYGSEIIKKSIQGYMKAFEPSRRSYVINRYIKYTCLKLLKRT